MGAVSLAMLALPTGSEAAPPTVVSLRLEGVVDPFEASYITSGIEAARAEGASAVLLTIDTPGGLDSSMRKIVQAILNSRVPVVCYVAPEGARAASAGTFILIACPVAAMAPGTNVGAAHPVGVSGAILSQKVENDAAAYIRSLAERRGRDADWAERAVRESVSVSASEALRIGVIDLVAPTARTLLRQVDGRVVEVAGQEAVTLRTAGAVLRPRSLGVATRVLHGLLDPSLAFIFFYLGLALVVIELLHPGISVPGVLGVLLLVTAFVSFGMLPIRLAGVLLLIASAALFLLELKHPGIGLPTVGGLATLIAGGLLLFDPQVPRAQVSPWIIAPVAAFVGAFFTVVVRAALRARHLPAASGLERLVGQEGSVVRDLDPEGIVQVAFEEWTAVAVSGTVPRGERVKVVEVDGLRLKVEPAGREAPVAPGGGEGRAT